LRLALVGFCACLASWQPAAGAEKHREETRDYLRRIVAAPSESLGSAVMAKVRPEDSARLLREYTRLRWPAKRVGIALALGYAGGAKAFAALTNTVTVEFSGTVLGADDDAGLVTCFNALGIMAQENDQAYAFLRAGLKPETWANLRKWRSAMITDPGMLNRILVDYCIHGLGRSGREEVGALLEKLRREPHLGHTPTSLLDAMRDWDIFKKLGRERFRKVVFTKQSGAHKREWLNTEKGMDWWRWRFPPETSPGMWKDGRPLSH
jgi:hypothetical protein